MSESVLIKQNGEQVHVTPSNGKVFTLEELQGLVGGYIETITLDDENIIVVNEEGKFNGSLPNAKATEAWEFTFGKTDIIYGDVLICAKSFIS